jgi:hypothetical protein
LVKKILREGFKTGREETTNTHQLFCELESKELESIYLLKSMISLGTCLNSVWDKQRLGESQGLLNMGQRVRKSAPEPTKQQQSRGQGSGYVGSILGITTTQEKHSAQGPPGQAKLERFSALSQVPSWYVLQKDHSECAVLATKSACIFSCIWDSKADIANLLG